MVISRKACHSPRTQASPHPHRSVRPEHQLLRGRDHVVHQSGLTLVGLVGLTDPPRDEIPDVCNTLRGAGIRIFMVTGDFKLTAAAIARECGIITVPETQVHTVEHLQRFDTVNGSKEGSLNSTEKNALTEVVPNGALVISGPELITLNDTQWRQLTDYQEIVFARTTPDQKLRIVKEFQARGNLVGMTGDGVNDAPSLKAVRPALVNTYNEAC